MRKERQKWVPQVKEVRNFQPKPKDPPLLSHPPHLDPVSLQTAYPPHADWSAPLPDSPDSRTLRRKNRSSQNFKINKFLVSASTPEEILSQVAENLKLFNFVNLGTALYRLALVAQPLTPLHKQHLRNDPRLLGLLEEVGDTLEMDAKANNVEDLVLAPKELSNIVWAATKLGISDSLFFSRVERHLVKHMEFFDSVNLSLTLWGFAKMDIKSENLFVRAAPRVEFLLPEFEPHRICNTVWAFAKAGFANDRLFGLIAEECLRKINRFNHSNESMLLYSFALGGVKAPFLFSKMLARQLPAIQSREVADPRSLSNLLWGLAQLVESGQLSHQFKEAFAAVSSSALENMHRYSLTHMATLCSAFAKAGIQNEELFTLVSQECGGRDGLADPASLTDLLTLQEALNAFGHSSHDLDAQISKTTNIGKVVEQGVEQEGKCYKLFWDLVGTSLTALIVILIATIFKKTWGVKTGDDQESSL